MLYIIGVDGELNMNFSEKNDLDFNMNKLRKEKQEEELALIKEKYEQGSSINSLVIYFDKLSFENQISFLIYVFKDYKNREKKFEVSCLKSILRIIDKEKRINVLKEYEKYFPFKSFSIDEIDLVLLLDENSILPYLFNKIDLGLEVDGSYLWTIYEKLSIEKKKIMLKEMITRDLWSSYCQFWCNCGDIGEKIQVFQYILELTGEKISKYLGLSFINGILNEVPVEQGKSILSDYIEHYFDYHNIDVLYLSLRHYEKKDSYFYDIIYNKMVRVFIERYNLNSENTNKFTKGKI